jgi:hypothetical protein
MKPGNLGLDTYLVEDCCFAVALRDYVGRLGTADEVHAMSLANLDGDRVVKRRPSSRRSRGTSLLG